MDKIDIDRVKKDVESFKNLFNLLGIRTKIEKEKNEIKYVRFINSDYNKFSTTAVVWDTKDWQKYKKIKVELKTKEHLSKNEIKWLLILKIYKESIKFLL